MALRFLSPIHKASRQIGIYLESGKGDHDLTNSESHILTYLRSYAPCSIGDLHKVFGYKRSTLTSLLDRLCEKGYAAREADEHDRRTVILTLSRKGKALADRINRRILEFEEAIRRQINGRDLEGFQTVMAAIASVTKVQLKP